MLRNFIRQCRSDIAENKKWFIDRKVERVFRVKYNIDNNVWIPPDFWERPIPWICIRNHPEHTDEIKRQKGFSRRNFHWSKSSLSIVENDEDFEVTDEKEKEQRLEQKTRPTESDVTVIYIVGVRGKTVVDGLGPAFSTANLVSPVKQIRALSPPSDAVVSQSDNLHENETEKARKSNEADKGTRDDQLFSDQLLDELIQARRMMDEPDVMKVD